MERFLLVFLVAHMIPPFPSPCITWEVLWGSTGASGDADGVWVATSWCQAKSPSQKNTKPFATPKIMWVLFNEKNSSMASMAVFKPRVVFLYVVFSVKTLEHWAMTDFPKNLEDQPWALAWQHRRDWFWRPHVWSLLPTVAMARHPVKPCWDPEVRWFCYGLIIWWFHLGVV